MSEADRTPATETVAVEVGGTGAGEWTGPGALIESLTGLVERKDRAALAALRRGVGRAPGEVVEMCRYVDPRLPATARWDEEATYYLVAALFGWHPSHRPGKNLGGALAELAAAQRQKGNEPAGIERRIIALLDAHRDDLPTHLRHAVGLLRSAELPLDYALLLRHVDQWDHPQRFVQREWARAFWGRAAAPGGEAVAGDSPS